MDGRKFDKVSFVEIAPIDQIDVVVTNTRPPRPWVQYLEQHGIQLLFPQDRK